MMFGLPCTCCPDCGSRGPVGVFGRNHLETNWEKEFTQLCMAQVEFPRDDLPYVDDGQNGLTGNQCVEIAETLDQLARDGLTAADPKYAALLTIFSLVEEFAQKKTRLKEHKKQQRMTALRQRRIIFTKEQKQQLQLQLLAFPHLMKGEALNPLLVGSIQDLGGPARQRAAQNPPRQIDNSARIAARNTLIQQNPLLNDPATYLAEVYARNFKPSELEPRLLMHLREENMKKRIHDRQEKLEARLSLLRAGQETGKLALAPHHAEAIAALVERESTLLDLKSLQFDLRTKVVKCMQSKHIRGKREIETQRRQREKTEAKVRRDREKFKKKFMKAWKEAVLSHSRDFQQKARQRMKTCKFLAEACITSLSSQARSAQEEIRRQQRERLLALQKNDIETYKKLLEKSKNKRMEEMINQTDTFMKSIFQSIKGAQASEGKKEEEERERRAREAEMQQQEGAAKKPKHINPLEHLSTGPAEFDPDLELERMKRAQNPDPVSSNWQQQTFFKMIHANQAVIANQPRALRGGILRSYQLEGLRFLVSLYDNKLNGILADEMGLGKTIQSVALIAYLMEVKQNPGPFLIIVPMSTLHNNWKPEFETWLPDCKKVIYDGKPEQRKELRARRIDTADYNAVMTTYDFAMKDKGYLNKIDWEYLILDEAHRLKNPDCKLQKALATYKIKRRIALTGTPLQNDLKELWALLNFLQPSIFNSQNSFEKWFAQPLQSMGVGNAQMREGEDEELMSKESKLLLINRLHQVLGFFMLRREKQQVETELPARIEKVLRCKLTPVQRLMYELLEKGQVSMQATKLQLRKVCNHPYLFHPYVAGQQTRKEDLQYLLQQGQDLVRLCGKFALLDQILPKLKETGHRVLLFSQWTSVLDVIQLYLEHKDFKYLRFDGNTNKQERQQRVEAFQSEGSEYFIFMLSTKAGGVGINLQTADTVIIFDTDFNPQNDQQAMARSHRIGQKRQVLVLRLMTSDTIEEEVLKVANNKKDLENVVVPRTAVDRERALSAILDRYDNEEDEETEKARDIVDDEEVSYLLARDKEEADVFEKMDRERKARGAEAWEERNLPKGKEKGWLKIPKWINEWCHGNMKRGEESLELVDVELKDFWVAKDPETGLEPTFAEDSRSGRMVRATRKNMSYTDDHEMDELLTERTSSSENEDENQNENEEEENDDEQQEGERESSRLVLSDSAEGMPESEMKLSFSVPPAPVSAESNGGGLTLAAFAVNPADNRKKKRGRPKGSTNKTKKERKKREKGEKRERPKKKKAKGGEDGGEEGEGKSKKRQKTVAAEGGMLRSPSTLQESPSTGQEEQEEQQKQGQSEEEDEEDIRMMNQAAPSIGSLAPNRGGSNLMGLFNTQDTGVATGLAMKRSRRDNDSEEEGEEDTEGEEEDSSRSRTPSASPPFHHSSSSSSFLRQPSSPGLKRPNSNVSLSSTGSMGKQAPKRMKQIPKKKGRTSGMSSSNGYPSVTRLSSRMSSATEESASDTD
eukprot:g48217.t1